MDRALQQALFASFAQPRAAPSHSGSGRVTITRTITRPSGHSTTTRHTRDYGRNHSSSHHRAPVARSSHASSSFHSVAAPVVRSGGGRTFDSYRHETARRQAAVSRSSRRPDTNGRFNRLERDGIRPTPTSGRHAATKRSSSKGRSGSGSSRSSRRVPTPKRALVTEEGETFRPLGSGWVERTIDGEWVRSGLHTQMEADTQNWYIATYEPTSSHAQPGVAAVEEGMVNIEIAIKSTRPSDPGPDPASVFHVVVGYKSPRNFYMVVGDVQAKEWRIEHADGTVLSRVADTSMKQDIFFNLVILLRRAKISVDANGTSVFGRVMVPEGGLRGDIGVACRDSKLVFKGLRVSPAPGSKAASMVVKTSPRSTGTDVVVRSGSSGAGQGAGAGSRMEVKTVHAGRRAGSSSGYGAVASSGYGAPPRGSSRGRKHEDRPVRTPPSSVPTNRPRFTDDDPRLIEMIERNVLECDIGVTFEDIAALDDAKRLLNEAVVLPLLVPEFFTGIREPWKGVLLFGPPGTGKTMLAKAVAGMNGTVFFNVSAATLVSKWRGESEKLVQCLFNMARHYAPSIIFIDEIDCLVTQRGTSSEHEASRRLKTQFLTQMDGITSKADSGMVMVLATSNTPWDLDEALRRRLEKRIHIPLPGLEARTQMFGLNLKDVPTEDSVSPDDLAADTEGYSGADIHLVCREASMMGMRRLLLNKTPQDIQQMRNEGKLTSPPVSANDLKAAISRTRPSVSADDTARFEEWERNFGST